MTLRLPKDWHYIKNFFFKIPNRQVVREGRSKRFHMWRSIMKALTFYFRNLKPTQYFHRFILPFLTLMVDLTFGNILNVQEQSSSRQGKLPIQLLLTCKSFNFCKCTGECPLKALRQPSQTFWPKILRPIFFFTVTSTYTS